MHKRNILAWRHTLVKKKASKSQEIQQKKKKRLTLDKLEEGEFWDHWNVEFTIPSAC